MTRLSRRSTMAAAVAFATLAVGIDAWADGRQPAAPAAYAPAPMPSPADFFPVPQNAAAQPPRACSTGPTPTSPPDLLRTNSDARRVSTTLQAWGRRHFRFTGPEGCGDPAFVFGQYQALAGLPQTGTLDAATIASVQQELAKAEPRYRAALQEWSAARGAARMAGIDPMTGKPVERARVSSAPGMPSGEALIEALRLRTGVDLGRDLAAPACSLSFMTDSARMTHATFCAWPTDGNGMLASKEDRAIPDDDQFIILFLRTREGAFDTHNASGRGTLRGRKVIRYEDDVIGTAATLLPMLQPLLGPPAQSRTRRPTGLQRPGADLSKIDGYTADVDTYKWTTPDVTVELGCPGWFHLDSCSLDVRLP